MVEWIPVERDRLFRDWEKAADEEARVRAEVEAGTTHGGWVWFYAAITDRCREELATHDRFAAWATGWLTARWQRRMGKLVELW